MKLPLSWVKEFLPKLPPLPKLVEQLVMHGLEVEKVIDRREDFKKVVVGEIVAIRPHPNADKLRLADVMVAGGKKAQEIVCGAPNILVGQKVPVALLGAKLPNGLTIARREIRGIVSNGMICAADELGLGNNHSGVLILDPLLKVGTPFARVIGADEVILDLAIPANRSDLFSVRGLAREIGAMVGVKTKFSPVLRKTTGPRSKKPLKVKVSDPKLCLQYSLRTIYGVTVTDSPAWLQNRLRAAGMRPVNSVVDVTNYIMLEYGQPLHAFDLAAVHGTQVTVRLAKSGEKMKTLDGQERHLDPSMLVIADAHSPMALAGVMGAARTEIHQATTDIILEAAIFNPVNIRRTSWKLGLQSEASRRFEKGLPLNLPAAASQAATAMILKICGGTMDRGMVSAGKATLKMRLITIKPAFIASLLGTSVPAAKAKSLLQRLGFKVSGSATWRAAVPSWRLDVMTPEDIVDEVGRLLGYDHLPRLLPAVQNEPHPIPELIRLKEKIQNILVGFGFTEILTHAFYGQADVLVDQKHFSVANPLDKTQQYLRRSLIPNLKHVLEQAVDAGHDAQVFELGRVFTPEGKMKLEDRQPWKLGLGLAGKPTEGYKPGARLASIVQELFSTIGLQNVPDVMVSKNPIRGRSLEWCELDVAEILNGRSAGRSIQKYPTVRRDISAFVPEDLEYKKIIENLVEAMGPDKELLDLSAVRADWFRKEGQTSITLSLAFRSPVRAMTKEEIDGIVARLHQTLTVLGATIR